MARRDIVREELETYRAKLDAIEPLVRNWSEVETWKASVRPWLLRHFSSDLQEFDRLAATPSWSHPPIFFGPQIEECHAREKKVCDSANDRRVAKTKDKVLAFLGSLIRIRQSEDNASDVYLPFRPYRRFSSQMMSIEEAWKHNQVAALQGAAESQELAGVGGATAVIKSIQKHIGDFDPSQAGEPYAPAWINLKPFLIRCGLSVDEDTTLTDIKGFLDDLSRFDQGVQMSEKPKRRKSSGRKIFIGHGRSNLWKDLKDFLQDRLKLEWDEFNREPTAGISTQKRLETMLDDCGFAFLVMTGEDQRADGTKQTLASD